jgi:hypothetical protein
MNFIKKWYKRIVGWLAAPIAQAMDLVAEYTAPLIAVTNGIKIDWSWRLLGRLCLAGLVLLGAMIYVAFGIILSIAGLTLLFGLLLNPLVANILALMGVGYVAYDVVKAIDVQRADVAAEPT